MSELEVPYNGRMVPKRGFRVFIYGRDGQKKLINSWNEFREYIPSDNWFLNLDEVVEKKPRKKVEE